MTPITDLDSALANLHELSRQEQKPTKKRKSWGQVLPEPKTSLPPRKRAKTEDEKEQRRIERVKRNRLAAHNSRERKRSEMDRMTQINEYLAAQIRQRDEHIEQLRHEVAQLRNAIPGNHQHIPTTNELPSHQTSPHQMLAPSPAGFTMSMSTPSTNLSPHTPAALDFDDDMAKETGMTRYPAAMSCEQVDLQCQPVSSLLSASSPSQRFLLAMTFLTIMASNLWPAAMTSLSATLSTLTSLHPNSPCSRVWAAVASAMIQPFSTISSTTRTRSLTRHSSIRMQRMLLSTLR